MENFHPKIRTTLGLNSPREIRRQPSRPGPYHRKFSFSSMFRRYEDKINGRRKAAARRPSLNVIQISQDSAKQTNSFLFKIYIRPYLWVKISSNKATCVFNLFAVRYYVFCTQICANKFAFELICVPLRYLLLICVDKAGRSPLLYQIKRSRRFLPRTERKYRHGR